MKHWLIGIVAVWLPIALYGQWYEDFSDADSAYNAWSGDWERFAVNRNGQLQSQSAGAAESALWHESTAAIEASWSGWVRISGTCSAYNLVRCYLTLAGDSLSADAYYVQIGGANKNIVLYEQRNSNAIKVIENQERKKILSGSAMCVDWRVTRGADGMFHLYSQIEGIDSMSVEEGAYFANEVYSTYFAVYVKNSKQRGYDFYMDNISVSGVPQALPIHPEDESHDPNGNEERATIRLLTESISPNGDGYEDEACLSYILPDDDYRTTLSVYTPTGVLVKQICKEQETPATGTLCWDGADGRGASVEIGVYVLAVEMKNSKTKDALRRRFAVAVTR